MKPILRWVLAAIMMLMGVLHFVRGAEFARTIPAFMPAPLMLVWISGVFELLGGVGLLVPRTRRFSAWGLMALYLAVFPANINMAVNHLGFSPTTPSWVLWARLPFQIVLIAWVYWVGVRKDAA